MAKQYDVLLVEDDSVYIDFTKQALKDAEIPINLNVVTDGMEALDYLHRRGQHTAAVRPDVILLDLKLPKKKGHEVLQEIREDESLRNIPVVVLTSSDAQSDIITAYSLDANSYITKPSDFNKFMKTVKTIVTFWCSKTGKPAGQWQDKEQK